MRKASGSIGALVLLAVLAVPAASQLVTIRGRVIDGVTRAPVRGAFVARTWSERGVLTDSAGIFALELRTDTSYPLSVENLGYRTVDVVLSPDAPQEFTTILLPPDPVALEGLTVLVDRFERRRRTYFGTVNVIGQDRLMNTPSQSAFDLVRRSVPFARQCNGMFENLCLTRRGRNQVVQVCIDERPAFAGAVELESYDTRELYLVEVYGWGQQVRVYTRWYVDRMLDEGRGLKPLTFGC